MGSAMTGLLVVLRAEFELLQRGIESDGLRVAEVQAAPLRYLLRKRWSSEFQ